MLASLAPFLAAFAAILAGIFLIFYVYSSYCLMRIGRKLNSGDDWMAWVPIAQIFYFIKLAGKPNWWAVLAFAPTILTPISLFAGAFAPILAVIIFLTGFVFYVFVWLGILARLNMSKWLLILLFLPVINFFVLGYIAFSKPKITAGDDGTANPQLVDYINQQLAAGMDRENITQTLLGAGWQEQDIENAFGGGFGTALAPNYMSFGVVVVAILTALSAVGYYYSVYNFNNKKTNQINVIFPSPSVSVTPLSTPTQSPMPSSIISSTPKPKTSQPAGVSYSSFIQGLVAQGWKKATFKPAPDDYGASFSFYYPSNFTGQNTGGGTPADGIGAVDNPISDGRGGISYDSVAVFHSESNMAFSKETAFDAEIKFVTAFAEGSPVITDFVTAGGLSGKKVIVTTSSFGKPTQSEYIILHTGRNSSRGDEIAIRVDIDMNYVDIAEKIAKSISLL